MTNNFIEEMKNIGWEVIHTNDIVIFRKDGKSVRMTLDEIRKVFLVSIKNHIELL